MQYVSKSDMLIYWHIKTDVIFAPARGLIRGVNKNPNNLITNKPILEIEKLYWKAESIRLPTLEFQKFTVPEKGETGHYF